MRTVIIVVGLSLLTGVLYADVIETADSLVQEAQVAAGKTGEQINWQVISSGGTKGSSTNYNLSGTVGQTAVGEGTSTNYGLRHGYWQDFGEGGCCNHDGIRGDENYDLAGPNIVDLTYLVANLFGGGPAPPCFEEGDCNADAAINIVDLTYLVAHLFGGGPAPLACP